MIRDNHISSTAGLVSDALRDAKGLVAVFLCGSWVSGAAQVDSDIDFTVLVDSPTTSDGVIRRLADVFDSIGLCHDVPQYRHEDTVLSVSIILKSDADYWVDHVFRSVEDLLGAQAVLQHKLVEAVQIAGEEGVLAEYQSRLADYPESLAQEVRRRALDYLREEYLDDWGFRSVYHFGYCLCDIMASIGTALYARNKRFYMPPLKRLHRDLPELDPHVEEELAQFVSISLDTDLQRKRELLERIVRKLSDGS